MKREKLVAALRTLADAVEVMPDETADRLRVDVNWFQAANVEDLRRMCEVFPGKREILKLSSPDTGAVETSLGPIRAVVYYNRGILGDKVTVTEPDLSLLDAPQSVEV